MSQIKLLSFSALQSGMWKRKQKLVAETVKF